MSDLLYVRERLQALVGKFSDQRGNLGVIQKRTNVSRRTLQRIAANNYKRGASAQAIEKLAKYLRRTEKQK